MNVKFICGCGLENLNTEDWFCHFKERGFLNGLKNLLLTKIVISWRAL